MKIVKKINNNVAFAIDESGEQCIVTGKGIGFGKFPINIENSDDRIEEIYYSNKFTDIDNLFKDLPVEIINITKKIIDNGERILNKNIYGSILYALSDHIYYSVERSKNDLYLSNNLQFEIKHLYPKEMRVGLEGIKIINEAFDVSLGEDEAAFIALHFVNADIKGDISSNKASEITDIIKSIINIIKYTLKIEIDFDSIYFSRFVSHLRYFIIRQINNKSLKNENADLYELAKVKYGDINNCVLKISEYLYENYKWNVSIDEKLYLILHIFKLENKNE